jgi:hypothetical protein
MMRALNGEATNTNLVVFDFRVKQESITHSKCSYIRELFTKTSNTIPSPTIKDKCSVPKFYLKFIGTGGRASIPVRMLIFNNAL